MAGFAKSIKRGDEFKVKSSLASQALGQAQLVTAVLEFVSSPQNLFRDTDFDGFSRIIFYHSI